MESNTILKDENDIFNRKMSELREILLKAGQNYINGGKTYSIEKVNEHLEKLITGLE